MKRSIRGTALLGVAAIAAGSLGMIATPAIAAPGDGTANGTVTVHKLERPDSGNFGKNDGSELTPTDLTGAVPLVAGFTACEITNIDLAKQADWLRLKNLTATGNDVVAPSISESSAPANPASLGACQPEQMTAAADGTTTFTLAADRAYLIYESTLAVGASGAVQPTIITVPYPGKDAVTSDTVWNYNPHIYPKNSILGKGSTKNASVVGDQVSFDVMVPIVSLPAGEKHNTFVIEDQLSGAIQFTGGKVVLTPASGTAVQLVEGTDYSLTEANGLVTMTLLAPGLLKVDGAVGGKLVFTIDADLVDTGDTTNSADVTINGKTVTPEVPNPEDGKFWKGHIFKEGKDVDQVAKPLAGAEFEVYLVDPVTTACEADAAAAAAKAALAGSKDKKVNGTFTSGANGQTQDVTLAESKYCAYETKVPAGYKATSTGHLFDVNAAGKFVTVVNAQIGSDDGDLPSLPITGAAGQVLLLGGGTLMLAAAGVLFAARRRKQAQEA